MPFYGLVLGISILQKMETSGKCRQTETVLESLITLFHCVGMYRCHFYRLQTHFWKFADAECLKKTGNTTNNITEPFTED